LAQEFSRRALGRIRHSRIRSLSSPGWRGTMYRAIPVGNKACADRVRQREHEMHKQRIKAMRPQTDTTSPQVMHLDHLRNNLKREQLLEDRYHEIDRENRILLQKMSDIMKHPSIGGDRGKSGPVSLNRDQRKTELMRITQENQSILKRIQRAQPVYNHVAWEDSHRKNFAYLKNTSEYPLVLMKRKNSSRASSLTPLGQTASGDFAGSGTRGGEVDGVARPATSDTGGQLAAGERFVLKEGKRIGEHYYLIEMSTDGRTLAISAYDGDNSRTLELLVNEKNHRRLYRDSNGDYNAIMQHLRVDGDQLLLDIALDGDNPAATA